MTEFDESMNIGGGIGAQLVKLDGKIDLLRAELASHRDLLMAEIKAGDRESGQAIALTNERLTGLNAKVTDNIVRIKALEVIVEPVPLLRRLIYGAIGLILIAFLTAVVALVIKS